MLVKDEHMQTVYVDMDDVLCQTAQHFLEILERDFGKKFAFEQLTDFDVGQACELTAEEREVLYRIVHDGEELLSIPPIPGAVDVLQQWSAAGRPLADQKANSIWKQALAEYREPSIDPAIREALVDFVERRIREGGEKTDF